MRRAEIVAFTAQGVALACRAAGALAQSGWQARVSAPARHAAQAPSVTPLEEGLASWCERAFACADALVFVGATGIAVRAIAPQVKSKHTDPAVICMDEQGKFAIALLSGHIGGANRLARTLGDALGAQAVVTTATDGRGLLAVDEWAADQGLRIVEPKLAKEAAALLLDGKPVGFKSRIPVQGALPAGLISAEGPCDTPFDLGILISLDASEQPFARTLHLMPRCLTLGIGCRRGTSEKDIERVAAKAIRAHHLCEHAVARVASIDVKADEAGLISFAARHGWPLCLYSTDELNRVPGTFSASEFVQRTVGTDNVCERAALCAGGTLVAGKLAEEGVTVAIAREDISLSFPEEVGL